MLLVRTDDRYHIVSYFLYAAISQLISWLVIRWANEVSICARDRCYSACNIIRTGCRVHLQLVSNSMRGGYTLLRDETVVRASHDHSPLSSIVVKKVPPRLYDTVLKHSYEFAPVLLHVIADFQSITRLCKTVREVLVTV